MRKLFLTLLLILFSLPAWGAWQGDGSSQYVDMAYNSAEAIPVTSWAIACWAKVTSNTGTGENQLFAWAGDGSFQGFIGLGIGEATAADANDTLLFIFDPGFDGFVPGLNDNSWASNTSWTHIIIEASGTPTITVTLYINGSSIGNDTNSDFGGIDITDTPKWVFLSDWDTGAARDFFNGAMAECAKWNRTLSTAEKTGLAGGFAPNCYSQGLTPGNGWYVPMVGNYQELVNGATVTNHSTTQATHPRIISCN